MNNSLQLLNPITTFILGNFVGLLVALGIFIVTASTSISQDFDRVNALSLALLTSIVGGLGAWIAYAQWKINQRRLQHELFDRRIKVYQDVAAYIANILVSGKVKKEEIFPFLRDTKHSVFIFDKEIADYVDEIQKKANSLLSLYIQRKVLQGERLDKAVNEEEKILTWLTNELNKLPEKFEKFLKL
ncbi:MAG: hypothetical protein ABIH85_02390 [Candidatus Omnitrophota bacterium]|nr:hypothetical protein [Candidatus Omnitrophota bacterium]